jgi:hypothetical protein
MNNEEDGTGEDDEEVVDLVEKGVVKLVVTVTPSVPIVTTSLLKGTRKRPMPVSQQKGS